MAGAWNALTLSLTEVFTVEMLGRQTETTAMVLGEHILIGVTVLEELDLMVDCHRNRLVPCQGTSDQPVFRI
jgi:hypothetical protein